MKIPKVISKNGQEYIFEKEYTNFLLYRNMLTGAYECFSRFDLGLIKKQSKVCNISPEKLKR